MAGASLIGKSISKALDIANIRKEKKNGGQRSESPQYLGEEKPAASIAPTDGAAPEIAGTAKKKKQTETGQPVQVALNSYYKVK